MDILEFNLPGTFFIFYETEWTCWVFLLPVRSLEHLKEIQAFEVAI